MKKKLIIALFISMLLVMPMNNNYVNAAKSTPTKEVATTNYTITYNLNGGTNSKSNPTKYNSKTKTIKLKNPTRSGYAFEGWYKDAKLKKKVTSIKKGSKGNVTLYAKWSRYTITYNLNGGTNNKSNPTSYNKNTKTIKLKNPTRKGYDFLGWYKDAKLKKKVTSIKKGSKGNLTLYAKWESNADYKIAYNLNGGKNSKSNPVKYNKKTKTIKLKNPTKAGYTFGGWYKDSKLKKKVTQIKKGSKGNVTLYAKWNANTYTIKFDKNGANKGKMSSQTKVKYGSSVKLNANKYTKNGYAFIGWNTKKNGKGTTYADKASVKNLVSKNKGTITLYAMWANQFTIKYNLNGGVNNKANPTKYKINTEVVLKNPTRSGYKFLGWYTDSKFKNKVTKISKNYNKNITLYAKWESTKPAYNATAREKKALADLKNLFEHSNAGECSYVCIVTMLQDEGYDYTEKEAKYAADNCGIDWKNQANNLVKRYTTQIGISYVRLVEYMKDLKYTDTEIKNAITVNKVNWSNQALLLVKTLTNRGLSKARIIEEVKDMKFEAADEKAALASINVNNQDQALKIIKEMLNEDYGYSYNGLVKMLTDEYYLFTDAEVKNALNKVSVDWSAQALKRVKSMLNEEGYGYSYNGIINNLTSEWAGFTEEQVKTALSKVTTDWSAQALKRIKNMLDSDSYGYSYDRVVKDLTNEYNAFSETDVKDALSKATVDWNAQALKRVKNMLNSSGYSYARLLELLQDEYNGFTAEQAKYAVDNCKADWNEQALRVAKDSLESTNYSYKLMLTNLQSEWSKFTPEQAKYAADNCGADWNTQALKRAKEILESSIYSKEELLETLQEEWIGFTLEQATYAVNNCGANWNEQAQKRAKELIGYNNFSHKEVMEELKNYYKFTAEEAKYGADNCGANWNDNALKAIDSRLGGSAGYSDDDIKGMLMEFGFTEEQAAYAIANYVR